MGDDLVRRLRSSAMAHYRTAASPGGREEVTCPESLAIRDRWKSTSCGQLRNGHRCGKTDGQHDGVKHRCACGIRWGEGRNWT